MKFNDVDIDKLDCYMFKDMHHIKYYDEPLVIQSPWLQLTHYGIPRADKLFNTTEESRRYLRVPLEHEADNDFTGSVKKLDAYFSSEYFKHTYLNDKQQNYTYNKMFKETNNNKYPPSLKLKLDVKDNVINTNIFKFIDDKTSTRIHVKNMDDITQAAPYKSDVRFIFKVQRLWVQPSMKGYGVILKLRKIQVRKNSKTFDCEEEFIESDEDNIAMVDTSNSE